MIFLGKWKYITNSAWLWIQAFWLLYPNLNFLLRSKSTAHHVRLWHTWSNLVSPHRNSNLSLWNSHKFRVRHKIASTQSSLAELLSRYFDDSSPRWNHTTSKCVKISKQILRVKKKMLLFFFCQVHILDKDSGWLRVCVKWFKLPSALETVMGCDRSADTTRRRQLSLTRAIVFLPLGALPASGRKVDQLGVANQAAAISGPFFPRFLRSKFKSQNYYSPNA